VTGTKGFDALRARAEQMLKSPSEDGVSSMVEEMSVLWTELELQADELMRSERTAQEVSEKYFSLFDEAPTCFLVLDGDEHILETNRRTRELLQLSETNQSVRFDFFVAAESQISWARLWRERASRLGTSGEMFLRPAGGGRICVQYKVVPWQSGASGTALVALNDVTQTRAAERARNEATEQYRRLFASSRDGIVLVDPTTRQIVEANTSFAAMLGMTADELREQFFDRFFPTNVALMQRLLVDQARENDSKPIDIEIVDSRGRSITTEITVSTAGGEKGAVDHYIIRDVTERRNVAERALQAQKMEAVGQLASGIAHELNNVLMVITTVAETLPQNDSPDVIEARSDLIDTARRGRDLIATLMTTARRNPATLTTFDATQLVSSVGRMLQRLVPSNIAITLPATTNLALIIGDESQVHQALLNLVINARDAMVDGGEIRLAITTNATQVKVSVRDTGRGMSAEVRRRAIEPFFTTKPLGHGTGLGLTTAYAVMNQHHGTLDIESAEGAGTTVTLTFPLAMTPPTKTDPAPAGVAKRRILVVDDEPLLRKAADRLLRRAGHDVLVAASADEAATLLANAGPFDVVLTDIAMPGRDGLSLIREIRPMYANLKIIAMSGLIEDYISEELDALNVKRLSKPFENTELLAALSAL
jgi:PAS domain S-box-containing protein